MAQSHLLGKKGTYSSSRGIITHLYNALGMLANHYVNVNVIGSGAPGSLGCQRADGRRPEVVLLEAGTRTSPMTFLPTPRSADMGAPNGVAASAGSGAMPTQSGRVQPRIGGEPVSVVDSPTVDSPAAVDRTTLHRTVESDSRWHRDRCGDSVLLRAGAPRRAWRSSTVASLCALGLSGSRPLHSKLYARDIRVYDDAYRSFIRRSLSSMRKCKIRGHTLLWEASRLPKPNRQNSDELLLDLGVWLGWSTRLISDASGRQVYGFDTFEGLVEDWQVDDQILIKRGSFSLSEPLAQRSMRDTGVNLQDGVPAALGRKVQFVKGSTYETLAPFLADRPDAPIRLFHMDLDTYESCLHALETCKDRFIEGSILVFDEYLVTNAEMRAFFEFQNKYALEWRYRAWGLEVMEMNLEMVAFALEARDVLPALDRAYWLAGDGSYVWKFFRKRFWRFWLGAPIGDILFMLGAAGQRKSVSLEITGLGKLDRARPRNQKHG